MQLSDTVLHASMQLGVLCVIFENTLKCVKLTCQNYTLVMACVLKEHGYSVSYSYTKMAHVNLLI